ncbi:MAG: hypothetical protein RL385_161 [Pseudomonadota bacterium]|jgi:site-specific recombinase XerD
MQLSLWEPEPDHAPTGVYRREASPASSTAIASRPPQARQKPKGAPGEAKPAPGAPLPAAGSLAATEGLDGLADRYVAEAHAERTRTAYQSDWRAFATWCDAHGEAAMPASPRTLERYLAHLAARGLKASTIRRARIAIGLAHGHEGLPRPDQHARIRALERGIGRVHGTHEEGAEPLLAEDIAKLSQALGKTTRGERDRALILVGFAGALRASELVGLDITNVKFTAEGLDLFLARSKEDQLAEGARVRIVRGEHPATCPVTALRTWILRVGRPAGPLFRHVRGHVIEHARLHPRTVSRAVQAAAAKAGLPGDYSSHSLRSGLATSAYANGAREKDIREHGRWKSYRSLDRYIRLDRISDRANPAEGLL